jgi:hypothetical protein
MGVSTLSGLVAALLAAVAPSTAAKEQSAPIARIAPPARIRVLDIPVSTADKRTRTCNARGSQRQSNRVERNLAPVACEQPPRSKVILTFQGGLFGSGR